MGRTEDGPVAVVEDLPGDARVRAEERPRERDAFLHDAAGEPARERVSFRLCDRVAAAEDKLPTGLRLDLREVAPPAGEVVGREEALEHGLPRRAHAQPDAELVRHRGTNAGGGLKGGVTRP